MNVTLREIKTEVEYQLIVYVGNKMAAKGVTLASTDFPLYTFRMIGDRHFLVAGGGGAAKTGVPNAMVC